MIGDYKIIGVALTKLHEETMSDYVQALHNTAIKNNYRLVVFNSFLDFFKNDSYDRGAKSVYELINFQKLDALIIFDECFYDKDLVEKLIQKAHSHNIPVVTLYKKYDGCFCVTHNYDDVFKGLVRHVIEHHHAEKIYFVAGTKDEENSEKRLSCFKDEMYAHGLGFSDDMIFYGNYWNEPTYNAVDSWIKNNNLPDAVVCANDTMAMYVCERLKMHNYSVPEDVIVTGFDGIKSLAFKKPRLSTCYHDIEKTAFSTFELIKKAVEEHLEPCEISTNYSLKISESCGCKIEDHSDSLKIAEELFAQLINARTHEEMIYSHSDRVAGSTNWDTVQYNLNKIIMTNSDLVLNNNLLSLGRLSKHVYGGNFISNKVVHFASNKDGVTPPVQAEFSKTELLPDFEEMISNDRIFVFQSIYVEDEVCGYYVIQTSTIRDDALKLRRTLRTINLDFSIILNRMRQEYLSTRFESLKTRDSLTGLINLKGLMEQFENNYNEYSQKAISVSIYAIPQYKYIMENYGIADAENAVCKTSEALQFANCQSAIISRISEDEFIVINLDETPEIVGAEITRAVGEFFKIIEDYNSAQNKDYYIEVNCGCIVSNPGWENNLPSFIKASKGEMYLNKLKSGYNSDVVKEDTVLQDYDNYKKFDLLISKNLFEYHFQPIVDAKTGEIRAYEALMRTDENINLSPLEILDIAKKYKRLYDVERATLFNVFDYIENHRQLFKGRKVFINTIPGCFLNESDYDILRKKYWHLFKDVTIELTEQNETEDAELRQIRTLEYNSSACEIAIDDYGTGYSNIVNLLRYQPNIIKIDRYLINGVENDANKQHFISSTIEFAKGNNIMVLAEGVETKAELTKVIELGVDLVQGYLTARPNPVVITEISDDVKQLIINESNKAK